MNSQFDHITWYGRGPEPTYSDRKQAPLGLYSGSVAEQYVSYSRPQENGNKVDVRWVAVTSSSGSGLLAKAEMAIDAAGEPAGATVVDPHGTRALVAGWTWFKRHGAGGCA